MKTKLLDIGGTFIKCDDGRQIPISSQGSRDEIADSLKEAIGPTDELQGVGICIPGPFDYRKGIFLMQHKFGAVYGENFRTLADVPEHVELRYMHDVNAPLAGAVKMLGLKNAALVTLGTGLGFSYTLDGKVQMGEDLGPARDLWNLPWNGGILKDFISARGVCNGYAKLSGNTGESAYGISQRANAGEAEALKAYSDMGALLGEALQPLLKELGVDTLLMGGQVSKSLDLMIEPLQKALEGVKVLPAPENVVFKGLSTLF